VAMAMMAPAVGTQALYRMRGGPAQDLSVDLRKAVCHTHPFVAFHPTVGGYPYQMLFADPRVNPMMFGIFPTRDGRWYLPTAAYPHMVPQCAAGSTSAPSPTRSRAGTPRISRTPRPSGA